MSNYLFQLGNTPDLSRSELGVFVSANQLIPVSSDMIQIELPSDLAAQELMSKLGGTVKILRLEQQLKSSDSPDLKTVVIDYLLAQPADKITFGLMEWGRDHLPVIPVAEIKSSLISFGKRVRYHEGSRHGLSASILLHHPDVIEVALVQIQDFILVARTVAVQDIDAWTVRDRDKPYADRRKGMLPPKVARMMVNLAVGDATPSSLVYDPFCGTGTILIEALMRGCQVAGSDIDPDSVTGTDKNLHWLSQVLDLKGDQPLVFEADAARAQSPQLRSKITHIVTEPFLGKPTPQPSQLPNIFKGLQKMYWGAFKNWTSLLADQARIVIVFPYVITDQGHYSLDDLIDKLAPLGYTMESEPVMYHRPQAVVQRQIHTFSYNRK